MIEIESKYFIDELSEEVEDLIKDADYKSIVQSYLLVQDNHEIRIRIEWWNNNFIYQFTHKIKKGEDREEYNIDLTLEEYTQLRKDIYPKIVKTRYMINDGYNVILVDKYRDFDFFIAEIEFQNKIEQYFYDPPLFLKCSDGIIHNVSKDEEFKDSYFAKNQDKISKEYLKEQLGIGNL